MDVKSHSDAALCILYEGSVMKIIYRVASERRERPGRAGAHLAVAVAVHAPPHAARDVVRDDGKPEFSVGQGGQR